MRPLGQVLPAWLSPPATPPRLRRHFCFTLQAKGAYAVIGGGQKNVATGDYSTVHGGRQNTVISNYGSIMGGYKNKVAARFGVVLGGSKNTVHGRHSAALGFGAIARGTHSMVACFTGSETGCDVTADNTISFHANKMYLNDVDLGAVLAAGRRMLAAEPTGETLSKASDLINDYTADYEQLMREVEATLAHQDALMTSINSKLQ
jgi:hypothetical protein